MKIEKILCFLVLLQSSQSNTATISDWISHNFHDIKCRSLGLDEAISIFGREGWSSLPTGIPAPKIFNNHDGIFLPFFGHAR